VETAAVVAIIGIALFFDYTNGFHDSANAIATAVSTRALTPRNALLMAAALNLAGAFLSTQVAKTVGKGIITPPTGHHGMVIVFSALVGAIVWNLITWYFGLPSSSTHALVGGLVGAALASSTTVEWSGVKEKVLVPMVVSPLVGFLLAFVLMLAILWTFRRFRPAPMNRAFRGLQVISSAAMSLGHGLQDAQKTMGAITLLLIISGHLGPDAGVPWWVKVAAATAISLGTYSGGWRIMRTLGRRVFKLDPAGGFAAQTVAAGVLFTTAYAFQAPISTTHVISSSVMGVGAPRRISAVRWGVAGNIVVAWILTLPAAGLFAAGVYAITNWIVF
jgi:PiT family inorganic phosphate transporter